RSGRPVAPRRRGFPRRRGSARQALPRRVPPGLAAVGAGQGVVAAQSFSISGASGGFSRATWLPLTSVNQRWPSGPGVIPLGEALARYPGGGGTGNSVTQNGSRGTTRATLSLPTVNQRFPSGPLVMAIGWLSASGSSRICGGSLGVTRQILPMSSEQCTVVLVPTTQRLPSGPSVMSYGTPGSG